MGIILHDLGKVIELTGPMTTEYTLAGNLVGHLVLVDEEITQACMALKFDDRRRYRCFAAYGFSPPWLIRIWVTCSPPHNGSGDLHQIDNLDASMQMMLTSIRLTEPGQYTDRNFWHGQSEFLCTERSVVTL